LKLHGTIALVAVAALVAGCGEGGKDAGVQSRALGDRPVYNMPDEFANISAICIKGHLVIETTQNNSAKGFWVSPADEPSCAGLDGVAPRETIG
jgi:hypothetical protein